MTDHEKKHLINALNEYSSGLMHSGDYQLWVGFGDHWTAFKEQLVEGGYLTRSGQGGITLSRKGFGLFEHIEPAAA